MKFPLIVAGAAALAFGTMALAESHTEVNPAVKARQSHMQLYQHNLAILGGMAQAKMDYDADMAANAAANLVALANLNQATYWPVGTDNATIEGTNALPAIWADFDGVMTASAGLVTAVNAMNDVAGTDLAGLQSGMAAVGEACTACHREYRQRTN